MATMQDVADRAGVSLSTVSYALSGVRPVSAETRERIAAAMAELGFTPNAMARGLASRRSHVLALHYPAVEMAIGSTVTEYIASAARAASESGYQLVLWPFAHGEAAQITDLALRGMADGVLLMEVTMQDKRAEALQAAGVPYLLIGRTADCAERPHVDVDFARTTEDAVAHLVAHGHRRIAFLNHSAASERAGYGPTIRAADGYSRAMSSRGLRAVSLLCDESPVSGRAALDEILGRDPGTTAVITMNEIATVGLMEELRSTGKDVPRDMSVLSIVSSPRTGQMSSPPLATMHAPGAALGRAAVAALLAQIAGTEPDAEPVLVPCAFEEGGTVGAAPHADEA